MIVELVALATLARQPMPSPVEPPTTHAELPPTFDEALEEAPTTTAPAATETPSAVAPASSPSLPQTGPHLTYLDSKRPPVLVGCRGSLPFLGGQAGVNRGTFAQALHQVSSGAQMRPQPAGRWVQPSALRMAWPMVVSG